MFDQNMLHRKISNPDYQMDSLDGLRGFAALIVVLSHTSNEGWFFLPFLDFSGIGKSGVYLFFLLSSFLLSLPLIEKRKDIFSSSSMINYWQRRFFRIYPLYIIYLACGLVTTQLFTKYLGLIDRGAPFELTLGEFFNHLILVEGKGVTWSIAVEFKFYFILPFLVWIVTKANKFHNSLPFILILSLILINEYFYPQRELRPNDTRLMPYMPIFLIGIFCAIVQCKIRSLQTLPKRWLLVFRLIGVLGMLGIIVTIPSVFAIITKSEASNVSFHKDIILISIFWAMVMMSIINSSSVIQTVFKTRAFCSLGYLSFSIYLIHPIFIGAINFTEMRFLDVNNTLAAWTVLVVTIVASIFSFILVERPASKINLVKYFKKSS